MFQGLIVAVVVGWTTVNCIPIDNGLTGDPEVECGSNSISINFNTNNAFEGRVFVKNHFNTAGCVAPATGGGRLASINLPFDSCSLKRERSATPKGVFVTTNVIISFHPTFVTKVDRAFRIQCFYMEADKTVSQEIEVSLLTTALATMNVPMPVCKYDILDGGPTGSPVRFVTVGQQVYHKWTCDSDTAYSVLLNSNQTKTVFVEARKSHHYTMGADDGCSAVCLVGAFCMVVYGCKVDDGSGDTIQLLDDQGCALDRHLLNNLEYSTDLMGGQEAHVFKYADRPNLYFNCQIRITVKDPGAECDRPQCAVPSRGKRSAYLELRKEIPGETIVDVSTDHPILVADIDFNENDLPSSLLHPTQHRFTPRRRQSAYEPRLNNVDVCFSPIVIGVLVFIVAVLVVALTTMGFSMYSRKH